SIQLLSIQNGFSIEAHQILTHARSHEEDAVSVIISQHCGALGTDAIVTADADVHMPCSADVVILAVNPVVSALGRAIDAYQPAYHRQERLLLTALTANHLGHGSGCTVRLDTGGPIVGLQEGGGAHGYILNTRHCKRTSGYIGSNGLGFADVVHAAKSGHRGIDRHGAAHVSQAEVTAKSAGGSACLFGTLGAGCIL